MGFGEAPTVTKAAVVIAVIAFVFNIIGFAAPYWIVFDLGVFKYNEGLWMVCGNSCNTIEEGLKLLKSSLIYSIPV
ncbi:hypothetical protein FSP39_018609 [Pinctada imbricata]|uniref:Uncharacterized protein n=1 Tax=Pinctada imbricata TaxID=66713 RepID=A0AA89BZG8_PINIB|nr:hypothetical protein FSP39_018609 [Pinctada imbricata]